MNAYLESPQYMRWASLSAAEREREYSPSSALADGNYRPFIEQYRTLSDQAWSTLEAAPDVATATVVYGPLPTNTIDVAIPRSDSAVPLVVFIHGGYWQELSKHDSRFAATGCIERGWAFAALDYTLAPNATLDEIVDECRRSVATLKSAGPGLGFDPNRFVIAGSSAGAHLAAMVACDPTVAGSVVATVLVSGIYQLQPLIGTSINGALGLDVAAARCNSPLCVDAGQCLVAHGHRNAVAPALIAYGAQETSEFKAQSHRYAAHLRLAGAPVETIEIADRNHFDVILDLARSGTQLGDATARLSGLL